MDWDSNLTGPQAKCPSERLAEFVSRNYSPGALFLDIGPGKHAPNQHHLMMLGYDVVSVDISMRALANYHHDICAVTFPDETFHMVYDINTLCHVENPPIKNIHRWLKPGGKLFSIAPTEGTWRGVGVGKDHTRYATAQQIESMYAGFHRLTVGTQSYSRPEGQVYSWIIEATK